MTTWSVHRPKSVSPIPSSSSRPAGASPAGLTLVQASEAIGNRELTPLELTSACLELIEASDPVLRAFITLDAGGALDQARALTEEIARSGPRSPLHGIPVGIKDLIDVAGMPTTAASRVLRDNIAGSDAPVISRLRAAGAVVLGKTNTQEFAYGVVTRPTCNPWNTDRIPGGSSGGSAVAVASGMCPGALGTDTAGSVRIPAALCGVSGLRPRSRSVPLEGIIPLSPSLDACGPIARDVADLELMWEVLSGGPNDAHSGTLRVAYPADLGAIIELDPEVGAAFEAAVAALAGGGVANEPVDLPSFNEWDFPRAVLLMVEALLVHEEAGWYPERAEDYTAETLQSLRYAADLPATLLMTSQRKVASLVQRWLSVLEGHDVLALPTTPDAAPTIAAAEARDHGHRTPVVRNLTRICGPVNCCNLASVAVPCGFTDDGLPIGVQFIAANEDIALAAGAAYQSITDWHLRRPPAIPAGD
jgi:aspartyl-tRNA(Asn)/glutamyl-tRNA(Gln) amidotransferase subunit A